MTFRNSSISSSKYLIGLAVFTSVILSIVVGVSILATKTGQTDFAFSGLYSYQLGKIESQPVPDIVFVGDSSLGNAIDVGEVERLTGMTAVNLALTGAYGFAGDYNVLRRVLSKGRPKAVVFMHSPDALSRPLEHEGYLQTFVHSEDLLDVPFKTVLKTFFTLDIVLGMARRVAKGKDAHSGLIVGDYVRQARKLDEAALRNEGNGLKKEAINRDKDHYLRLLTKTCSEHRLDCFYAHGPWFDGACGSSGEYLRAARGLIAESGLHFVEGTPTCLPAEHVGDSADHVDRAFRVLYTRRNIDLLRRAGAPWPTDTARP
jgi:hypothetical protein